MSSNKRKRTWMNGLGRMIGLPYCIEGARHSEENMTERLNTVDINVDATEHDATADSILKNFPKYGSNASKTDPSCVNAKLGTENSDSLPEEDGGNKNTRALAADEPTYKLETFEKNAMIIFNQYNVNGYKTPRVGTKEDGKRIKKTFEKFGFKGKEHMDLTKKEIFKELDKFSFMDFTDYGCVVIVVMTHGDENGLLMAKDEQYSELEILQYFKHRERPKLVTKPVVVIIQACRGIKNMEAAEAGRRVEFSGTQKDSIAKDEVEHYHLPVEADTIVLHSSYISKASHREVDGTWFIKSLCKAIDSLSVTHDLESIMIEVKREIAIEKYHRVKDGRTRQYKINKQMPVVTSALIRKLYLRKIGDEPPIIQQTVPNAMILPLMPRDCTDNEVNLSRLQGQSPAEILKRYQYMRNILELYAKKYVNDKTAEYLLRNSAVNETNWSTNTTQMTLLAMSNFIKNTLHQDYMFQYRNV